MSCITHTAYEIYEMYVMSINT